MPYKMPTRPAEPEALSSAASRAQPLQMKTLKISMLHTVTKKNKNKGETATNSKIVIFSCFSLFFDSFLFMFHTVTQVVSIFGGIINFWFSPGLRGESPLPTAPLPPHPREFPQNKDTTKNGYKFVLLYECCHKEVSN